MILSVFPRCIIAAVYWVSYLRAVSGVHLRAVPDAVALGSLGEYSVTSGDSAFSANRSRIEWGARRVEKTQYEEPVTTAPVWGSVAELRLRHPQTQMKLVRHRKAKGSIVKETHRLENAQSQDSVTIGPGLEEERTARPPPTPGSKRWKQMVQLPSAFTLWLITALALVFFSVLICLALYFKTRDERKIFRAETGTEAVNGADSINEGTHVAMAGDELLEIMGLGGLALQDMSTVGFNGVPLRKQIPLLALQSWVLQFGMLFFLITRLQTAHEDKALPVFMVFMSIYLHFVSCIGNFPMALSILCNMHEIQSGRDLVICLVVFTIDQFILPSVTVVVGGLYLCTSKGIADLILNSCAVAFIGQIDDWIMNFNLEVKRCAGMHPEVTLYFPTNYALNSSLERVVSLVPVVPVGMSFGLSYLGLWVLHL